MSDWSVAPANTFQSQYPAVSTIQHIPSVTDDKQNNHQEDK